MRISCLSMSCSYSIPTVLQMLHAYSGSPSSNPSRCLTSCETSSPNAFPKQRWNWSQYLVSFTGIKWARRSSIENLIRWKLWLMTFEPWNNWKISPQCNSTLRLTYTMTCPGGSTFSITLKARTPTYSCTDTIHGLTAYQCLTALDNLARTSQKKWLTCLDCLPGSRPSAHSCPLCSRWR